VLGHSSTDPSHTYVLEIQGLAVHPAHQRHGAGRRLVQACLDEARSRPARELALRVLSTNPAARQLYESFGFRVEGILREEFFLSGRYVDNILMAASLSTD
jgi:ribosomal protein S18 acetylase RimI-like enzyme